MFRNPRHPPGTHVVGSACNRPCRGVGHGMAPPNLTRVDAERRAALLDVAAYAVELDLTDGSGAPGETTFATTTTVRFACREPGARQLDRLRGCRGLLGHAQRHGARRVRPTAKTTGSRCPSLAAENELVVVAHRPVHEHRRGPAPLRRPRRRRRLPLLAVRDRRRKRMFACFDQPDLKARYTLTVTAPADWKVVSNATAEVEQAGRGRRAPLRHHRDPQHLPGGAGRGPVRGVARRARRRRTGRPSRSGIYCRASLAEHMDAERLFTETKQGFDFYHRNFGIRYPFGKYDQLFVPEFNAGAMENAGAVTFLEDYVFRSRVTRSTYERRAETVLHEMAHMWFGDLVTMRWWDDLWLNESFATFASVLCQARPPSTPQAWTTFANVEKSWAYRQDQLPSTHPVAADIPDLQAVEVNFDGITYAKGASVLKQLVAYVGLEPFLAGLRAYFEAHKWGNATFDDLLGALEQASGRDLSGLGRAVAQDHRAQPAAALVRAGRRRRVHPLRRRAGRRPARRGRAAHAPDRRRGLRRRRVRQARAHPPRRGGRRGRAHRGARAGRRVARQARAGQRRRPHLLRAAAGPGLARHADRPDRRHRRAAPPHPLLELGVGDDPRGRAQGPRLHRARGRRVRRRDRDRRRAAAAAAGPDRDHVVRGRAVGRRAGLAGAGRRACGPGSTPRRRARTPSSRSSTRSPAACCPSRCSSGSAAGCPAWTCRRG